MTRSGQTLDHPRYSLRRHASPYQGLYGKLLMSEMILNSYIGLGTGQSLGSMTAKRAPER
ncbi:hypothetical protein IFM47457_07106 [Aspergillus lentulus]|nr:hypothetical protein IFM47457_07106 [Aspergillus lentulus]